MTVTVTVAGAIGVPDEEVVLVVCAVDVALVYPLPRTIIVIYPDRAGNIDSIRVAVVTHAFAQERVGRLL